MNCARRLLRLIALGLGLDPARDPYSFVGLYFRTRAEAQDFADLHAPREAGIVTVRTYCLD